MFKFKKSLIALLVVLVGIVTLYAQGRGTPSNLRVRIDANGALVTASAAQVNPVTSVQFSNARLATDASGNLLTVISGGSGVGTVTSVATTSPITGGTITSTGTIACATCLVSTTPVTIGQGGTGITSLTPASYTPTLTNIVVGDGTSLGSQLTVGKLVHWYFSFTFGSTSTITNPATFTVPTAAANSGQASTNATCWAFDSSTSTSYELNIVSVTTTTMIIVINSSTSALSGFVSVDATTPFTWTTSDTIQCGGTYFGA